MKMDMKSFLNRSLCCFVSRVTIVDYPVLTSTLTVFLAEDVGRSSFPASQGSHHRP